MHNDLVSAVSQSLEVTLPDTACIEEFREKLAMHINHLINHDFEKLVYYLYRIDVNENKMRALLEQKEGEGAAQLITDLIIERQLQKIKSRKESKKDDTIPEDEKW